MGVGRAGRYTTGGGWQPPSGAPGLGAPIPGKGGAGKDGVRCADEEETEEAVGQRRKAVLEQPHAQPRGEADCVRARRRRRALATEAARRRERRERPSEHRAHAPSLRNAASSHDIGVRHLVVVAVYVQLALGGTRPRHQRDRRPWVEGDRERLVVRHQDDRDAVAGADLAEQREQPRDVVIVETGEWLVEQQHAAPLRQLLRESGAAAHSAAQL